MERTSSYSGLRIAMRVLVGKSDIPAGKVKAIEQHVIHLLKQGALAGLDREKLLIAERGFVLSK